jgi:hypothetical protein
MSIVKNTVFVFAFFVAIVIFSMLLIFTGI